MPAVVSRGGIFFLGGHKGTLPALLPLPVEPFRYYQYGERTGQLIGKSHETGCQCNLTDPGRLPISITAQSD